MLSYRQMFTDPRLQALIEQALAGNRDLRTAYADVAAARAQVRVTREAQFPALGGTAGAGYADGNAGSGSADFSLRGGVTSFEGSEEHTSELQSLMPISYAVFCLKKKQQQEAT